MACMKLRSCFRLILIAPLVVLVATQLNAQTPETKAKPTGSISGRVTVGEKPAPGILVVVSGVNSEMPMAQTTSDADGNYRLGGLAAGPINVTPVAPVFVVPAGAMFGTGRVVNLSANETVEGIDFKLTRGGVITGRITDAEGRPIIEERVNLLFVDDMGAPVRGPSTRPANLMMNQTDDRGVYRIYGLPAGHYKVSAGSDSGGTGMRASGNYQRVFYPDASEVAKAAIVDVSAGGEAKNIDIKMGRQTATYAVSGRVIDADNGQPLAGVYFSFGAVQQSQNQSYVSSTSGPSSPTNSQGEFRMEGLSPGRYVFVLNPANFNPNATSSPKVYSDPVPFEILDGDVTSLEIKAQRGLSISGVVLADGFTDKTVLAKISNVLIDGRVQPAAGTISGFMGGVSSRVGADGSFVLDGLSPGKVALGLGYRGPDFPGFKISRIEGEGAMQNRLVELAPGQNISGLKIYLTYGTGVVRGQLKLEGGTLASDALIFIAVTRPDGSNVSSSQVDARGLFMIKGIPAGTYEVTMQIASWGSQNPFPRQPPIRQRQTVTIADGVETQVSFTLDLTRKDGP